METNWMAILLKDMAKFARRNGLDKTADELMNARASYYMEISFVLSERMANREFPANF